MPNPFFNRGPIREPRFFFPRPRETREICRLLAGCQNCSTVGPAKSGKTSLLLHLQVPGTLASHGLSPAQHSVVYLSFEGLGTLSPEQFFHLMLRETARQAEGKIALIWPRFEARDTISFLELKEALDQLEVAGERVVFLLDEVELAARNPAFDLNFFSALRHVAARPRVCFVTATERGLHELEIAGREVGSPFADLFSVVRLRPLERDAAWRSIGSLALEEGVDLSAERDWIMDMVSPCPFCLQVVAYEVFELSSAMGSLGEAARQYARSRVYEQVEPVLIMMWQRMSEVERRESMAAVEEGEVPPGCARGRSLAKHLPIADCSLFRRFLEERRRDHDARAEEYLAAETASLDRAAMYGVVRVLMRALEGRYRYAREHADQVARLAAAVADEMECGKELAEGIRVAGRLHDIGAVSISDMILLKPGPLTELETEIMRTHPLVGAQILDALEFPWSVKPAVRYHHERLDGSGYPEGLMGEEIPLAARILAVADVTAAMIADRPHRPARTEAEALAELRANAGTRYDAAAVEALARVLARAT